MSHLRRIWLDLLLALGVLAVAGAALAVPASRQGRDLGPAEQARAMELAGNLVAHVWAYGCDSDSGYPEEFKPVGIWMDDRGVTRAFSYWECQGSIPFEEIPGVPSHLSSQIASAELRQAISEWAGPRYLQFPGDFLYVPGRMQGEDGDFRSHVLLICRPYRSFADVDGDPLAELDGQMFTGYDYRLQVAGDLLILEPVQYLWPPVEETVTGPDGSSATLRHDSGGGMQLQETPPSGP